MSVGALHLAEAAHYYAALYAITSGLFEVRAIAVDHWAIASCFSWRARVGDREFHLHVELGPQQVDRIGVLGSMIIRDSLRDAFHCVMGAVTGVELP